MSSGRDHMQTKDVQEYLSFILSEEQYALDITSVKEIRGYEKVTPIANAPTFIKGVLNLRGLLFGQSPAHSGLGHFADTPQRQIQASA